MRAKLRKTQSGAWTWEVWVIVTREGKFLWTMLDYGIEPTREEAASQVRFLHGAPDTWI